MSLSPLWILSLRSFGFVRKIRNQSKHGQRFPRAGSGNLPRFELLETRITPAVHDLTQNTAFATIQAAINAANPGDTILADAGIYAESVTVNKSLVLEGAQHGVDAQNGRLGAQESILDAATNNGQTLFNITASNVTIDGFTVQNATNPNQFGFGILMGAGTSGTQVLNNIVQNNIAGISLANNSAFNLALIQHNLIQNNNQPGPVSGTGIYSDQFQAGGTLAEVLIDNNTFTGQSDAGLDFSSTDPTRPATLITVSNNLFDTNGRGLLAFNLTSSTISLNTFTNSTSSLTADIRLFEGVNGVTITNNLLQNGAGRAVRISNAGTGAPDATNIRFNQNSIAGYTGPAGIFQVDNYSGTLDASNNWWGSATGPTTPNNPGGTGQSLVDPNNQVVFSPYLTDGTNTATGRGFQPAAAATTGIALSGTSGDDTLVVFATGTDSGTYSLNGGPLVPFFNITRFSFAGLDGNDTFTINNPAGGLFAPADGIDYDGGSQSGSPGDALNILGGLEATATYTFTTTDANGHSGSVALVNGSVAANYTFTGLEPLTNTGNSVITIFNLPADGIDNQAILEDNGTPNDGLVQLRSGNGTFETTVFANPSSDTQIHASDDGETMTLSRLDIGYAAFVDFFGGAGNDTFNLDFTSGVNIIPTAGPNQVSFVGGGGTNRVFISAGSGVTNVDYTFADIQGIDFGPQAGTISFDGRGFTYQNIGPAPGIVDDLTVANRSFSFPHSPGDTFTLGDNPAPNDGDSRLSSGASSSLVDFRNPTSSLTVNGSLGADTFNAGPLDAIAPTPLVNLNGFNGTDDAAPDGSDVFNITPSPATTFHIDGDQPTPPVLPGDTLNVDTTGTTNLSLTATATPTGFTGAYTFGNRMPVNFQEIETLNPGADLALTKTGPATATAGTQVTYTLSVTNAGAADAQGVTLTDTLPSGETFFSSSEGSGSGTSFTDSIGTLAAGASRTVTLVAAISPSAPAGTLTDSADVTSSTPDVNLANNSATFDTTVSTSADVSITKTGPATVTAGTNVTYTLTTNNNGPSDAQSVNVSDTLPANTTLVSFTQVAGVPPGGTLPAGASQEFVLVVHVNSGAANGSTITNTAQVSSTTSDPNAANNMSTVDSTVVNSADVAITKTGPATVTAGTDVTYTLTTTNNGPVDAQNVNTSDTLPANTTLVSFTQVAGVPSGGTLPAGASQQFVLVIHVNAGAANGSTITNMAQVSSTTFDPNANNNAATVDSTVATSADLALTKTGPATATPGTQVTYTLSLVNNGPSDAQGVSLTDTLPAGTTFVSSSEGTGAGTAFADPIGTVAAGATRTVTLVAQVSPAAAGSTLTDSATVSGTTSDANAANNTATFTTTISAGVADLALTKTGPAAVTAGTDITYTLSVTNNGPSDAQNVTLSDTLPAGTTFLSASTGSGSGTSYSDSIGTLAAGASDTVTVVAKLSSSAANGSTITNSATASSSTSDTNAANNTATFDSTVSTSADLVITKTSPGSETEGVSFLYTISVANDGPSDAQNVVVVDTLPPGVIFNSANFSGGTVSQSGNTVTVEFGTIPSHSVIVGSIAVTPTEEGTIVNTVSVTSSTSDPNTQNNSASAQDSVAEGIISGQGTVVNGFERSPLTNVTVATFTHANGIEPASAFSATITWGDGASSPGTVTLSNGTYSVQGSHTYLDEHIYSIAVTVREETATSVILTPATILEELLPDGTRGTANQRFVSEVYRDMLGRKVDAAGLATWSAMLNAGATQFQVIRAIQTNSGHEFLTHEVDLLYQQYLHRSADPVGSSNGVNFLAAGGTVEQLATQLATSLEFNQRQTNGSNDSWLDAFYLDALGRAVDATGRAGWDQAFAAGASRAQVATAIFGSDEYRQHLVNSFYVQFLDRQVDQGGLSTWSGALKSGVRDELVIASIMDTDSHEFFNKTA